MDAELIQKIRSLLIHDDPEHQGQGLELARSTGHLEAVLEDWELSGESLLPSSYGGMGDFFTQDGNFAPPNDSILQGAIESGYFDDWPKLTISGLGEGNSVRTLLPLGRLANLRELSLSCLDALTNLETLPALRNLQTLKISTAESLETLDGIGRLEGLEALHVDWNPVLKTLDALNSLRTLRTLVVRSQDLLETLDLAGLGSLQKLKLYSLESLRELKGFPELVNLQELEIERLYALESMNALSGLKNLQFRRVSPG